MTSYSVPARTAYRHFQDAWKDGRGIDFESFVAHHADLEVDLRELHEQRIAGLLAEFERRSTTAQRPTFGEFAAESPECELELLSLTALEQRLRIEAKAHGVPVVDLAAAGRSRDAVGRGLDAPPSGIQRYRLQGLLGEGSFGRVFRAYDTVLLRDVALKILSGPRASSPTVRARFIEEAQIAAQLDHPGVVPVHDVGTTASGLPFLAMKLVKGPTLETVFDRIHGQEPQWPVERGVDALAAVCDVLAYCEAKGVDHRDLKPTNVMLGRHGAVHLLDWGLARITGRPGEEVSTEGGGRTAVPHSIRKRPTLQSGSEDFATRPGARIGTACYMAPERARSEPLPDGRSANVYAVGAMLYELTAGLPPYASECVGTSIDQVLALVGERPPLPVKTIAPDADAELVRLTEWAMARVPRDRPRGAAELAAALRAWRPSADPRLRPDPLPRGSTGPRARSEAHTGGGDPVRIARSAYLGSLEWALIVALGFVLGLWLGRALA